MKTKTYRLPLDQGTTTNPIEYIDAWRAVAKPILDSLPGYSLAAYDPGLRFDIPGTHQTFTLPTVVAKALGDAIQKSKQDHETLVESADLYSFLHCSINYALGRRTYITGEVARQVKRYWNALTDGNKQTLTRNLRSDMDGWYRVGRQIGDACDDKIWRDLIDWMERNIPTEGGE